MYIVSTLDLDVDPRITEEHVIEGESEFKVEQEMVEYLQSKYNSLSNPITLTRKVRTAIKNAEGKTHRDLYKEHSQELTRKLDAEYEIEKANKEEKRKQYDIAVAQLKQDYESKSAAALEEYSERYKQLLETHASEEEHQKFEEATTLAKEEREWEYEKAEKKLWEIHMGNGSSDAV